MDAVFYLVLELFDGDGLVIGSNVADSAYQPARGLGTPRGLVVTVVEFGESGEMRLHVVCADVLDEAVDFLLVCRSDACKIYELYCRTMHQTMS